MIKDKLFDLQDLRYKEFHQKLIPTTDPDTVIGVRVPMLRKLSKELYGTECATCFLNTLPHRYYEENNLHAFLIGQIKDFDTCIKEVDRFLPFVDNWATCDSLRPACFGKSPERLLPYIEKWLLSTHAYTVRFSIEMLMVHFLDKSFDQKYLHNVSRVTSDDYYVNMMIAWYFATALAKQYEKALPFITENRLSVWVHNKTIQKATESYRITNEQKNYLKTLKRPNTG